MVVMDIMNNRPIQWQCSGFLDDFCRIIKNNIYHTGNQWVRIGALDSSSETYVK